MSRTRGSWADVEVESEDQLNDPSSEDVSSCWSSHASNATLDSRGGARQTEPRQSRDKSSKKLRNKPLHREQLAHIRQCGGDQSPACSSSSPATRSELGDELEDRKGSKGRFSDGASDFAQVLGIAVQLPSAGSALHHAGKCRPCLFLLSMVGCEKGADCTFCHMHHASPSDGSSNSELGTAQSFEGLVSAGSALHDAGKCKPCLFLKSKVGCDKGVDCRFCHLHHKRSENPRPCKGKRDWYKKMLARSDEYGSQDADSRDVSSDSSGLALRRINLPDTSSDSSAGCFDSHSRDCTPRSSTTIVAI